MNKGIINTQRTDKTIIIEFSNKSKQEFTLDCKNEHLFSKVEEAVNKINKKEQIYSKRIKKGIKATVVIVLAEILSLVFPMFSISLFISLLLILALQINGIVVSMTYDERNHLSKERSTVAVNLDDVLGILDNEISKEAVESLVEEIDFTTEYSEAEKTFRRINIKQYEILEIISRINNKEKSYNNPFPPEEELDKVLVKKYNNTTY